MESLTPGKWKFLKTSAMVVVLLLVAHFMFRNFEINQVYHPSRHMEASGADLGRPWEDVYFTTADNVRLNGWFFPADTTTNRAGLVVLLCHGNAGNIGARLDLYQLLVENGLSVFAFDYRGFGRSEGRPTEEGTYQDASAALEWLAKKGFKPKDVIVMGESLGGGIASELAMREPLAGFILLSSFTSIPDIGGEIYPWLPVRWLSSIHYDTHSRLPKIQVPVLIMHSPNDGLIGIHHAKRNFEAANEPKLFWELDGTHDYPFEDREHFVKGIQALLQKIGISREANQAFARQ